MRKFTALQEHTAEVFYSLKQSKNDEILHQFINALDKNTTELTKIPLEYLDTLNTHSYSKFIVNSKDIAKITVEERDRIQIDTSTQSSLLWSQLRRNRFTASIAATIFKSKNLNAEKIWKEIVPNEYMNYGKAIEPLAIEALSVAAKKNIMQSGLWLDLERPWYVATS